MNTTPEQRRELRGKASISSLRGAWYAVPSDMDDAWGLTTEPYANGQNKDVAQMLWKSDAQFCAASDPATIIALLDDIERLESSRAMWKSALETFMAQAKQTFI